MPSLPLPELPRDLLRLYQVAQISQSISSNAGTTKRPMLARFAVPKERQAGVNSGISRSLVFCRLS